MPRANEIRVELIAIDRATDTIREVKRELATLGGDTDRADVLDRLGMGRLNQAQNQLNALKLQSDELAASTQRSSLSTTLLGFAIAGAGLAAAKGAWDLGAYALKQDAIALGGENARTSIDRLESSMDRLKLTIGRQLAPSVNELANQLTILVGKVSNTSSEADILQARYEVLIEKQRQWNNMVDKGGMFVESYKTRLQEVRDELGLVSAALNQINQMNWNLGVVTRGLTQFAIAHALPTEPTRAPSEVWATREGEIELALVRQQEQLAQQRLQKERQLAQQITSTWAQAWQQATQTVMGAAGKGQQAVTGLLGGTGAQIKGWWEPGQNGPFENIYRLADVAARAAEGKTSQWQGVLGVGPDVAQRVTQNFARGLMTPEVRGFIDKAQLVQELKLDEHARILSDAWAKEIAAQAGLPEHNFARLMIWGDDRGTRITEINTEVGGMADSMTGYLSSDAGQDQLKALGHSTLNGWITGMEDRKGDLVLTVENLVDEIMDAAARRASDRAGAPRTPMAGGVGGELNNSGAPIQ